jgi:hypothetical protein
MLVLGLTILFVYNLFYSEYSSLLGVVASVLSTIGVLIMSHQFGLYFMIPASGIMALLTLITWYRTKEPIVSLILAIPLLPCGYLFMRKFHGWHFIILSFLFLGIGAFISFQKGKNKTVANESEVAQ